MKAKEATELTVMFLILVFLGFTCEWYTPFILIGACMVIGFIMYILLTIFEMMGLK